MGGDGNPLAFSDPVYKAWVEWARSLSLAQRNVGRQTSKWELKLLDSYGCRAQQRRLS